MLTAAVLTPLVRDLAQRWGALDHALTSRKIHVKPVPRLGGIAIVLAFYAPLFALLFVDSGVGRSFYSQPQKAFGLFAGGVIIAALGIWDDLNGANAKTKFLVQFAVAGLMYAFGFRIDHIANPYGDPVQLGLLGLPFTLLWIVGVINALNLIDGLDGLAGGVGLIAIATTFAIAVLRVQPLMVLFTVALAGAVLGFLFYNFNPASIFMGDTGSMFLGFVLATTAIQTNMKSSTTVAIVVPIIALGVPIADTLLAMMRRAARGVPLFSGDRGHIHHRLLDLGLSQRQTVVILYGASIVLGLAALALTYATSSETTYFLLALSGMAYLALRRLGFISIDRAQHAFEDRKRNREVRGAIRRIGNALRAAQTTSEVWVATRMAAQALGATAIALRGIPEAGVPEHFSEGFDPADSLPFRARYGLLPERPGDMHIELGWSDGRTVVDRDMEIAIELLCDHVSAALERVGEPALPTRVASLFG
jgi:UDP-GlcNAc:undecaprenyl-phosphate GlcNAc-1-phosphate transferase